MISFLTQILRPSCKQLLVRQQHHFFWQRVRHTEDGKMVPTGFARFWDTATRDTLLCVLITSQRPLQVPKAEKPRSTHTAGKGMGRGAFCTAPPLPWARRTYPGLPLSIQRPPDLLLEQRVGPLQGLVLPGQLAEPQVRFLSARRLTPPRRKP